MQTVKFKVEDEFDRKELATMLSSCGYFARVVEDKVEVQADVDESPPTIKINTKGISINGLDAETIVSDLSKIFNCAVSVSIEDGKIKRIEKAVAIFASERHTVGRDGVISLNNRPLNKDICVLILEDENVIPKSYQCITAIEGNKIYLKTTKKYGKTVQVGDRVAVYYQYNPENQ